MIKHPILLVKNHIKYEFLLNYFILFVILVSSIFATYIAVQERVDLRFAEKEYVDLDVLYNDIESFGMEEAVKISSTEIVYIEYINPDLLVLDSYNSSHEPGYQYEQDELEEILDNYYEVILFYPNEFTDEMLLINAPEFFSQPEVSDLIVTAIILYLIFLMILLYFYSKMTSKRIIEPIQELNDAVSQIAEGNYTPRIVYESGNELGHLKKAIVDMAHTIEEGIEMRAQSEESRKQLILNISHDLKTPLTNIRGYAETISAETEMHPESFRTYIDIIRSNSIRADLLIHDLFELSKIESGEMGLHLKTFDLCEDLRRMIILHVPELEDQQMTYSIDIPSEKLWVSADKIRLDRAIGNIMINSIRYSGANSHLEVRVRKVLNRVEIIIEDNGVGMSHDLADTIFDPFVRADQARNINSGGSGLGLAITRSIIEKHKGSIELDRTYKEGCRFIIELPLSDKPDE